MLKIDPSIIRGIYACTRKEDLHDYLQTAVELEHATIPPYLTAMYSLMPGKNDEIASLIRSVVVEEMLHMTIAANILVATGGRPQINTPKFVPHYPGPLPMGIAGDLVVPIERFSKSLVKRVFMEIEEPEDPIHVDPPSAMLAEASFATIGQFYQAIQDKIQDLGDGIFVVGPDQQVLTWFDAERLFPIVDVASANHAIATVVIEGEGTDTDPFESPGEPAHYYRFGEIYYGHKLVEKEGGGYAYDGDPIAFDENGVFPMIDNPNPSNYAPGSHVATLSANFSYGYSSLLNALHTSFNGAPDTIDTAIGLMYQLRLEAQTLMATPVSEGSDRTAGPVYQYVTSA